MLSLDKNWTITLTSACLAVAFALAGLALTGLSPGAAPLVATGLLASSLLATTVAFARVAMRMRRLELENEGLIEELSQEFDRVKDKLEVFQDALAQPRTLTTQEEREAHPLRRVMVK